MKKFLREDAVSYHHRLATVKRECKMLSISTAMEKLTWLFLRSKPIVFKYQQPFNNYCADFYFPNKNLILEVDGASHRNPTRKEKDRNRDNFFAFAGIKTIRLDNVSLTALENFYLEHLSK